MESPATGDLGLLLVASALPLCYFVVLGFRERISKSNLILTLLGVGLLLAVSAFRILGLSVGAVLPWPGLSEAAARAADVILAGVVGPLSLLTGLLREVRRRRRFEERLRHEAHLFEAVLDAIPHAVFIVDNEGQTQWVHGNGHSLLGDAADKFLSELVAPSPPAGTSGPRQGGKANGRATSWPEIRSVGGHVVSVSKHPLPSEAGRQGVVVCLHDVTTLARLGNVSREFVATLSHDLRTPLTSIRGYLELLLEGDLGELPQEQRQALALVEQHAAVLERLVNDYLDWSRMEAGILPLRAESFDLRNVLTQAAEMLKPIFDTKGVSLDVEVPRDPVVLCGDEPRILQALCNLLSNAVKYCHSGGEVDVAVSCDDESVRVDVRDTGVGIPDTEQPYVFSRFFRGSLAAQSQEPGSGLGLAITKSIVEMHKGKIWFESKQGLGSTFCFVLPTAH